MSVSTTGTEVDADGYIVGIGATQRSSPVAGSVTFAGLAPGGYQVSLTGLAANCAVRGDNPRDIQVDAAASASVVFEVTCTHPPQFAFVSDRGGSLDVYLAGRDGDVIRALTDGPGVDWLPDWSPDGAALVFVSNRNGTDDIFVMNADGTGLRNLTQGPAWDSDPVWSPDGLRIAFVSDRDGAACNGCSSSGRRLDVYVMDADGGNVIKLGDNLPGNEHSPNWSPDGSRVAFVSGAVSCCRSEILVANAAGTGVVNPTETMFSSKYSPEWSPDGAWIAFGDIESCPEIFVMRPDGSDVRQLTADPCQNVEHKWSPDGQSLVFRSGRNFRNAEIYVMAADGTGVRNLSMHTALDVLPVWSSDGRQISFVSDRDGNREIYAVNPDGTGLVNLTRHPAADSWPRWRHGATTTGPTDRDDPPLRGVQSP